MDPLRVGVIGCGNISGIYFDNLTKYPMTDVVACADLDPEKARQAAEKYKIVSMTPEQLVLEPSIELVLNLTVPNAHFSVNMDALNNKKHVYAEKPLCIKRGDGIRLMMKAGETHAPAGTTGNKDGRIRVGGAPDTFLGAGIQTCLQLIREGAIGEPVGFNAFMMGHGPEGWHPNPEFYYQVGGGPMFDMGPYYITALVALLGPVKSVTALHRTSFSERIIGSEPKKGNRILVETPTHLVAGLQFEQGAIGQLTTSFDIWHSKFHNIEIYGTEGSLGVPDPNGFGGPIHIRKSSDEDWQEVEITRPYSQNSRGLGVLDMAYAIRNGRPHRASGSLAMHVLDVMQTVLDSGNQGERLEITSLTPQPEPLSATVADGELDG